VSRPSSPPNSTLVEHRCATLASPISRRDFGWRAAMAAAMTLSPATLLGSNPNSNQESKSGDKNPDKSSGGLTPEQSQEVEDRLDNIVRKYGNRLSGEQRQHLRRILTYNERMLASIRTFSPRNGDPPASVLKLPLLASQAAPAKPSPAASGESLHGLSGAEEDQV
jgi:hypothetical protein